MHSKSSFHNHDTNQSSQQVTAHNSISEKDNHDASLKQQQRQLSSQARRNIKNLRGSQQVISGHDQHPSVNCIQKIHINNN